MDTHSYTIRNAVSLLLSDRETYSMIPGDSEDDGVVILVDLNVWLTI